MRLAQRGPQRDRIHDPEVPTTIIEVVHDIMREESETKAKQRQARYENKGRTFPHRPCDKSPTNAHHFLYPAEGQRGKAACKYCGQSERLIGRA